MNKVILELRADNNLYDAKGLMVIGTAGMPYDYYEPEVNIADKTIELVKLGVSPDEIIKLKNQGLI